MFDDPTVDRLEKDIRYGGVRRNTQGIEDQKKYYYGTIAQLDDAFGKLMRAIDSLGEEDNTMVIFTSDNGPECLSENDRTRDRCWGTPGSLRGVKRYTYEGGHRVPGIIRWPGMANAGTVCNDLVIGTDYLPTMCELAGVPLPENRTIDGTSLVPLLENGTIHRSISPCWHFRPVGTFPFMAMRDGDYVILAWPDLAYGEGEDIEYMRWLKSTGLTGFELYDLKNDIEQRQDLSTSEPRHLEGMIGRMTSLWRDIQAEGPNWSKLRTRYDTDGSGQGETGF